MSAIAGGTAGLSIATPAGRGRKRGSSAATSRAAAATSDAAGVESLGGRSGKRKDAVTGGGEAGDDDDDVLSKPASSRLGATGAAAAAGADQGGHPSAGAADREGTDGRGAAAGFRDGDAATGGHRRAVSGNFAWLGTSTAGTAHAVKAALKSSLVALGAARSPASAAGKGALPGRSAGTAGEESVRAAAAQRLSAVLRHPAVPVVLPMVLAVVISAYFLRLVPGGSSHSVADESGWRLWWGANRAERMAAAASAAAKAQQAAVERLQEVVVRLEKRTESMAQALQVGGDGGERRGSEGGEIGKGQERRATGEGAGGGGAGVDTGRREGGGEEGGGGAAAAAPHGRHRARRLCPRHWRGARVAHSDALYTRQQQQQRQQKRRWSQVVSTVSRLASSGAAGAGVAASSGKEQEADLLHPNAQVVLTPGRFPGNCLPLKGQQGHIDIRLRSTIVPRAFTLEHLPKSIAYEIHSAPKDTFSVGEAVEEAGGGDGMGIGMVRVRVLSNYGHPNFTCIYRVRAHGDALVG
ncbi:unnamed protein product [Closterium sp. Yama58-4]|nr:unnamed protein product [Closterium sp. Yama58-4]